MTMATYLYCVRSDAATVPSGLVGIDGSEVRALDVGELVAWVGDIAESSPRPTVERLKAHDAVCAVAFATGGETPLPVRFGQIFADDTAAMDTIDDRATTLRKRLARIAGCAEMRVVVKRGRDARDSTEVDDSQLSIAAGPADESDPTIDGPGTAFLKRIARAGRDDLAREVGCEEARHAIRAAAHELIVEEDRCETARGVAFFPVLVRRGDADAFRASVDALALSQQIALSVLGPFAPYSFAGDA